MFYLKKVAICKVLLQDNILEYIKKSEFQK